MIITGSAGNEAAWLWHIPSSDLEIIPLKRRTTAPARSNRVAITRIADSEFQADGIVAEGRLRPVIYEPGANFPTKERALQAVLRWAVRNGAKTVYVEPMIE